MPSAAAIFPHLQPSIGVVRRTAAGIEVESRGPLAGIGGGPLLPVSFLMVRMSGRGDAVVHRPMSSREPHR